MKKFLKEKLVPFVKRSLAVLGIAWLSLFVLGNIGACVTKVSANQQAVERSPDVEIDGYVDFYVPSVEFLYYIPYGGSMPTAMCFGGITLRCAYNDTDEDLYPEYYSFDNMSFYEFDGQIDVPAFSIENGVPSVGAVGHFTLTFDFSDLNLSDIPLSNLQYYDVFYQEGYIGLDLFSPTGSALVTIYADDLYVPDYLIGSYIRFTPAGVVIPRAYQAGFDFGWQQGWQNGNALGYSDGYNRGYLDGDGDPFLELMNAIVFVPINFLWNLLNFNILGINMFMLFTAVITGLLLFALLQKVK